MCFSAGHHFTILFRQLCSCLPMQIFSIVVFATITAEGYINIKTADDTHCMYNNNEGACSYGVGIGVLAFLACVVFLLLDAYFPQISNAKDRKYIVIGDLVFSGKRLVTRLMFRCVLMSFVLIFLHQMSSSCLDGPVVHLLLCPGQPMGQNHRAGCCCRCCSGCDCVLFLLNHLMGKAYNSEQAAFEWQRRVTITCHYFQLCNVSTGSAVLFWLWKV